MSKDLCSFNPQAESWTPEPWLECVSGHLGCFAPWGASLPGILRSLGIICKAAGPRLVLVEDVLLFPSFPLPKQKFQERASKPTARQAP